MLYRALICALKSDAMPDARLQEEGGNAIADLIFGDAAPSGRLAQAWPRSAGAIHGPANPWYGNFDILLNHLAIESSTLFHPSRAV